MPKNTFVFLDEDTHARLKAKADAEGRSVSNYIGRLIEADLNVPLTDKKRGKPKKQPPFRSGEMVTIDGRGGVFKVMVIDSNYAMARRPGAIPFVEQVKNLRAIKQEAPHADA